jgi:hypothetical protein
MISVENKRKIFLGDLISLNDDFFIKFSAISYYYDVLTAGPLAYMPNHSFVSFSIYKANKLITNARIEIKNKLIYFNFDYSFGDSRAKFLALPENVIDKIDEYVIYLTSEEAERESLKISEFMKFYH